MPKLAYKSLRKISTEEDMLNWAVMGALMSETPDHSFTRSYFKRLLALKQQSNPFLLVILGTAFLEKQ